jgi:hypothetical protein
MFLYFSFGIFIIVLVIFSFNSYRLECRHENLEKLIIENTNITAETGNEVICLREDINSLL